MASIRAKKSINCIFEKFENLKKKIIRIFQSIKKNLLKHKVKSVCLILLLVAYYFSLPKTLFHVSYSTILESRDGTLLGAKIAEDGQWRFPASDSLPDKFITCITTFEDQYFYKHPGFNPVAMFNAFRQNQKSGTIVRGGSTITQQVIRLSRNAQQRTYWEKIKEIILATRLEFRYSKKEILNLYASHAPFGGNVVGLEMASYRYFGVKPNQLSWAENATLAVLPNSPSIIYPGKNQEKLRKKRDALLYKLWKQNVFDKITYQLAIAEPLPQKPFDLPQIAPHLLQKLYFKNKGEKIKSTIDEVLQNQTNEIAGNYYNQYRHNEIYNLAILVLDIKTRNVLAYVGNSPTNADHQKDVDIITAPRSTGSILKPFLYASMLDEGQILPNSLIADIPTQIAGYKPENFNYSYDGAVQAKYALSRSLNIPSVLMLQEYGVKKFYEDLQKLQLRDITKSPDHYGLSLILGGAESNLLDLCRTYADLSSTLNHFNLSNGKYRTGELGKINFYKSQKLNFGKDTFDKNIFGAGAIWETYTAMREVNRPDGDEAWKFYDSALQIAWKTGTSFGNRDAWAIGTDANYIVGIWVGNATGEGRPSLTGVSFAAPILFDVFNLLPNNKWFDKPLNDLDEIKICKESGYLAKDNCPKESVLVPLAGKNSKICPFHQLLHLDNSEQFQVNSDCENIENIKTKNWFILPPVMEWYYRKKHLDYVSAPPFRKDCYNTDETVMDFIYPKPNLTIYFTKNFNSEIQPVIFKVAHTRKNAKLFWYLDGLFLGNTQTFHDMPVITSSGKKLLTVVDDRGVELRRWVTFAAE